MKVCEKSVCSFQNWYPKFRKWAIRARFLAIPEEVVQYLRSDGVVVPREAAIVRVKESGARGSVVDSIWDEYSAEDDGEVQEPSFPDFSQCLNEHLTALGGNVFVKLNWSAPLDAAWIATNNCLKCTNLQDVYLLLKSSDKISKDLESPVCEFYLVFKKWTDIHPGSEFRCFVKEKELIAISQRSKSEYHPHILNAKCDIINSLREFFNENIKENFILTDFIFDVIWEPNKIRIIDFNTFNDHSSDSFLFSWAELNEICFVDGISPEFRFIGEEVGIQPTHLHQHFGIPSDLMDMPEDKSRSLIDMLQTQCELQRNEM